MMENINVQVLDNNYIVVKADTARFGEQAIMFEGNTFMQCLNWIARTTGNHHYTIVRQSIHNYRDREGEILPMKVDILLHPKS